MSGTWVCAVSFSKNKFKKYVFRKSRIYGIDENVIFQNFIMFVCNLTSYPSENSNLNLLAV